MWSNQWANITPRDTLREKYVWEMLANKNAYSVNDYKIEYMRCAYNYLYIMYVIAYIFEKMGIKLFIMSNPLK